MTLTTHDVLQHGQTAIQLAIKSARDALDRFDAEVLDGPATAQLLWDALASLEHGAAGLISLLALNGAPEEANRLRSAQEQAAVEVREALRVVREVHGARLMTG